MSISSAGPTSIKQARLCMLHLQEAPAGSGTVNAYAVCNAKMVECQVASWWKVEGGRWKSYTFISPSLATNWTSSALTDSRSNPCAADRAARFALIFSRLSRCFSPGRSLPLLAPLTAPPLRFWPAFDLAPGHCVDFQTRQQLCMQVPCS